MFRCLAYPLWGFASRTGVFGGGFPARPLFVVVGVFRVPWGGSTVALGFGQNRTDLAGRWCLAWSVLFVLTDNWFSISGFSG